MHITLTVSTNTVHYQLYTQTHTQYYTDYEYTTAYLYLYGADVVLEHHRLPGPALFTGQHTEPFEQGHVLIRSVALDGIHAAVDAPHTVAGQLGLIGSVVAVAVEDRLREYNYSILVSV